MFGIGPATQIYLAVGATDMRKGFNVLPAKYFVRVTKREKRACEACEERGVEMCSTAAPDYRKRSGQ
jgi:hypothetical protein